MELEEEEEQPLPQFRKDLKLYQGPDDPDGSPTFNLLDPVKVQYYRISWAESQIFKFLKEGMTLSDLCEEINRYSTIKAVPEELQEFFQQARLLNLLDLPRASEHVEAEKERLKQNPIKWLLLHYLYFRIPLINPSEFLERTLHYVTPLASRLAMWIYFSLSVVGVFLLLGRLEEYFHTFPHFFNVGGIFTYSLAIICVKIIHEFAHAYTAAYYRVHVPTMGVAFLVLWPVLYTDVTDSWKLKNRSQRLAITASGMLSELIIAGICTLGWVVTEPGVLRSIFFVLSSSSWISSLLLNINPAMRFDGYYLLADLWGIDNLQPRAFAVTRWKLRGWLWGLKLPCPEENLSEKRIRGMVVYSIYTWIYRLFLYTAIAVFIYITFTKALGVFLFLIEIALFIIWPLYSEVEELYKLRGAFKKNLNLLCTFFALSVLIVWLCLPLPRTKTLSSVTVPADQQVVYVPYDAVVKQILVKREAVVKRGDLLVALNSPPLEYAIKSSELEKELLEQELTILSVERAGRPFLPEKQAKLSATDEELQGLQARRKNLKLVAELDGQVIAWDETAIVGQSVARDRQLGKIANPQAVDVISFVPEDLVKALREGESVQFRTANTLDIFQGNIVQISPGRDFFLDYPQLASLFAGDLPVVPDEEGNLRLLASYYPIRIRLQTGDASLPFGTLGYTRIITPPQSLALEFFKDLLSLIWRESSL